MAISKITSAGVDPNSIATNGTNGAIDVNASAPADSLAIDASGRVGIGTSSPSFVAGGGLQISNASQANLRLSDTTNAAYNFDLFMNDSNAYVVNRTSGSTLFFTNNTERMRITADANVNFASGVSVYFGGVTSASQIETGAAYGMFVSSGGTAEFGRATTGGSNAVEFYNPNGRVGQIQTSGSSTAYLTSSDYRLKENVAPMTGALATVAALNPVTYTWKVDGSAGQGFIAHELQAVVPDCVTGAKDAVDANGKIIPQGIDTSFLVATLTAAIQELKAENDALKSRLDAVEALEARIAALEAA